MLEIKEKLVKFGNFVIVPPHTEEYALLNTSDNIHKKSIKNKINNDLIRRYYNEIKKNDAVLVVNDVVNKVPNYIGGNAFLEIGFAYILNKKIFLLNDIPNVSYKDEIEAMRPIVINGDLTKIV